MSWERVRKAADKFTTPLLPDDYLTLLNPLWSSRELRGRVEEAIPETEDSATLVIRPGWGWHYQHRPGQFVGIGVHLGQFVVSYVELDIRALSTTSDSDQVASPGTSGASQRLPAVVAVREPSSPTASARPNTPIQSVGSNLPNSG